VLTSEQRTALLSSILPTAGANAVESDPSALTSVATDQQSSGKAEVAEHNTLTTPAPEDIITEAEMAADALADQAFYERILQGKTPEGENQ
jgi:hypothetical protein